MMVIARLSKSDYCPWLKYQGAGESAPPAAVAAFLALGSGPALTF